jgi:hypothetical protein
VWSRSEGGRTGGAINRKPLQKKNNSEATGVKLAKFQSRALALLCFFRLIAAQKPRTAQHRNLKV